MRLPYATRFAQSVSACVPAGALAESPSEPKSRSPPKLTPRTDSGLNPIAPHPHDFGISLNKPKSGFFLFHPLRTGTWPRSIGMRCHLTVIGLIPSGGRMRLRKLVTAVQTSALG